MNEDYRDSGRVGHMVEACRKIIRLVDVSRADYDASEEKQLALERLFEIIGEAAAHVSDGYKAANPQIPWRQAAAMRNFVIHDYAAVSPDITWDTAQSDIPKLLAALLELTADANLQSGLFHFVSNSGNADGKEVVPPESDKLTI